MEGAGRDDDVEGAVVERQALGGRAFQRRGGAEPLPRHRQHFGRQIGPRQGHPGAAAFVLPTDVAAAPGVLETDVAAVGVTDAVRFGALGQVVGAQPAGGQHASQGKIQDSKASVILVGSGPAI